MEAEINQAEPILDALHKAPTGPKKRVLFVITQSELGGAQQFLARLLERLDHSRFECSVVTGSDGQNALASLLPSFVSYQTAAHLKRDPSVFDDIRSLFELRKIFKQYKPDIIFLNSSKAGFNGSWAASAWPTRLPNVTVMYRIGGWTFNDPHAGWLRTFFLLLEKFSAGWKDYIIVNNQRDYDLALQHTIRPRLKVVLIHNGIDPYMDFMPPEQARAALSQAITQHQTPPSSGDETPSLQNQFLIGVIANFYPTKGLGTLIQALSLVRSPCVTVISGRGQLYEELKQQIADLHLENKILLAGHIDRAWHYLKAFDLFVIPSLKEGFPWVALEAMAAKVPVIATTVGALPELIESGRTGLLVPRGDAPALAEAIETMISDERLRNQMALQAHQDIIRRFDIRAMIERYEILLSTASH